MRPKWLDRTTVLILVLDAVTGIAGLGVSALMAHILSTRHPAWLGLFLLSQALLLYALWQLHRLGRAPGDRGMGQMMVQLFAAIWALALPFMTATVMLDVAGVVGTPAVYEGEAWQVPMVITVFALAFVYPLALAGTITLASTRGVAWEDEKRVSRAELWNTAAVNLYLLLFMTWFDQILDQDDLKQLVAAYLMISVPRFVWLSFRFRPLAAASLVALLAWGLIARSL